MIKLDKRYATGLAFTSSYVFSKLLTDADSYWITDQSRAADQYNRRLEKSIGSYDVTHNFKFGLTYEFPFGPGKKYLTLARHRGSQAAGASRPSTSTRAAVRSPISGGTGLGIFNGRRSGVHHQLRGLQPHLENGDFDPAVDRFLDISASSRTRMSIRELATPPATIRSSGNSRFYNENSRWRNSSTSGERARRNYAVSSFNIFNRTRFGVGGTNVSDAPNFGRVTSVLNDPRRVQIGAKILF